MVNNRLSFILSERQLITPIQCGARKGYGPIDHLVRASAYIQDSFLAGDHVTAVFFDCISAYDNAWQCLILDTLANQWGFSGHLPHFIQNFTDSRTISVRCGASISQAFSLDNGIPQGSVLSGTLFGIAINSIADCLPPDVLGCLYVDDMGVFVRSKSVQEADRKLAVIIKSLTKWCDRTGFRFSPEKTCVVHFCRRRSCPRNPSLSLNDTPLRVVDSHRFLGLIFDNKLTWKEHITNLRASAMNALQPLKVISNRHWGADRKTLLMLYRALVRSKLDYGAIVYGSANATLLQCLDPVHNDGLRIATGAFKSTPVESLYVEACEAPLAVRRNRLLSTYASKVKETPGHLNHGIFTPSGSNNHPRPPRASQPVGQRAHDLYNSLQVTPQIVLLPHCTDPVPPWMLKLPPIDISLSKQPKASTPAHHYLAEHRRIQAEHKDWNFFYTDGSHNSEQTGAAFIALDSPSEPQCFPLHPLCCSYDAELYGLYQCLCYIKLHRVSPAAVFSDSLSALQALSTLYTRDPFVYIIQQLLHQLSQSHRLFLCWIPAHIGIHGNEKADAAAASAANMTSAPLPFLPAGAIQRQLHSAISHTWQLRWTTLGQQRHLYSIKPLIQDWETAYLTPRTAEIAVARLRLGHTRMTHGHLMSGSVATPCTCGSPQVSIHHLLIECPRFHSFRPWSPTTSVPTILQNSFPTLHPLLTFLSLSSLDKSL